MKDQITHRKRRHLDVCLDPHSGVQGKGSQMEKIRLPHRPLPELDLQDVTTKTSFLGQTLQAPIMISCMTGGTEEGKRLNRLLTQCANDVGFAIGTGSIRVMLRHPERQEDFALKKWAPQVPVLANIGAAQLEEYSPAEILQATHSLDADALYVHLNAAQEMFQQNGDGNFSSWKTNLARMIEQAKDFPILVKEVGAGIPPKDALELLDMGVSMVDIAGCGGTDWVAVESFSQDSPNKDFYHWGYPTAELLWAYRLLMKTNSDWAQRLQGKIIASGGLLTALDMVKALGCGASMAAAALPFLQAAAQGEDSLYNFAHQLVAHSQTAMLLIGAKNPQAIATKNLHAESDLCSSAQNLIAEVLG